MTRNEIEYQAEKLNDYIKKGGSTRRWIRSKGFAKNTANDILETATRMAAKAHDRTREVGIPA